MQRSQILEFSIYLCKSIFNCQIAVCKYVVTATIFRSQKANGFMLINLWELHGMFRRQKFKIRRLSYIDMKATYNEKKFLLQN
jgi:hypothetical protein